MVSPSSFALTLHASMISVLYRPDTSTIIFPSPKNPDGTGMG